MTKAEFIKGIREMADELEKGNYYFLNLTSGGYVFGNRNYGEVNIPLAAETSLSVKLYTATEEEKKEAEEKDR